MSLRVGVAGLGKLGSLHARILSQTEGAELTALYDARRERAEAAAALHGGRPSGSLEELFSLCDAVVVATPTPTHREVAGAALEAGRAVLVEKPLAGDYSEAAELVEIAAKRGVVLNVGHSERYNPTFRKAAELARKPAFVRAERLAPWTGRGADSSVVFDLMIHDLDLVLSLFGASPVSLTGVGVPVLSDTIDIADARLEFANGAAASLSASRVSVHPLRKLRVFTPSRYISMDLARNCYETAERKGDAIEPARVAVEPEGEPLALEDADFVRAARGAQNMGVSGQDALCSVQTASRLAAEMEERLGRFRGG